MPPSKVQIQNPEKLLKHILSHRRLHTLQPGVLTVSCYANFYPVCYHNKKGRIVGLDVDIVRHFCRVTGLELRLVEKKHFDNIWLDPIEGRADLAIGGIGITDERTRPGMLWSMPYFYVHRTLVYNRSHPVRRFPEDVTGLVRGTPGSTGYVDGHMRLKKARKAQLLQPGHTDHEDIQDLREGKIQGLLRGSFVGQSIVARHKDLGMVTPWSMDAAMVAPDGEVFAYPTVCASGVGQMMSVFLTEEIFKGELAHLVKKYHLD